MRDSSRRPPLSPVFSLRYFEVLLEVSPNTPKDIFTSELVSPSCSGLITSWF